VYDTAAHSRFYAKGFGKKLFPRDRADIIRVSVLFVICYICEKVEPISFALFKVVKKAFALQFFSASSEKNAKRVVYINVLKILGTSA
jgi:hypothetical protein